MRTERRSVASNDNGVIDGTAPPIFEVGTEYEGKFYSRGMRGKIEEIQVYCMRTGAGDIQLRYSIHPGLGPINTVTITPGPTWAWVGVNIEEMWNYDSLFLWFLDVDADVSWGYDVALPNDGHESEDLGATWADLATRPFIRIIYTAETPGDVPVSGIINNIPIPNYSTLISSVAGAIPVGIPTIVIEVNGAGYVDFISARVRVAPGSDTSRIYIQIDGREVFSQPYQWLQARGYTPNTPTVSLTEYNVAGSCTMLIHKLFEFRRQFRLGVSNNIGPQNYDIVAYPTLMR